MSYAEKKAVKVLTDKTMHNQQGSLGNRGTFIDYSQEVHISMWKWRTISPEMMI